MKMTRFAAANVFGRTFQFVVEADNLLELSWQERKRAIFIRIWLESTLWVTVMTFLSPFVFFLIPMWIWNLVALVIGARLVAFSFSETLLTLAMPVSAMVAVSMLIFTVPVMLLKQVSGEFSARR
jgi:hypothetical protein